MKKVLNYSNKFFKAEYLENVNGLIIKKYGIVVNLDTKPIAVDGFGMINNLRSILLRDYEIRDSIKKAVLVEFDFDPARENKELNRFCKVNWNNNKIRYPNDPSKWNYKILRSPVDNVNGLEFNCWFLPKYSSSSIHIEHPFREVHTQIYGIGIMNKYKLQDKGTLYQRMYMSPGFTHDTFYNNDVIYPWHQYEAVTDCIWMAICRY
jgi:hypothetical protein